MTSIPLLEAWRSAGRRTRDKRRIRAAVAVRTRAGSRGRKSDAYEARSAYRTCHGWGGPRASHLKVLAPLLSKKTTIRLLPYRCPTGGTASCVSRHTSIASDRQDKERTECPTCPTSIPCALVTPPPRLPTCGTTRHAFRFCPTKGCT